MKITSKARQAELDFDLLIRNLSSKYENIFMTTIDDYIFIYKPLSRKDYKNIMQNINTDDIEKEDEVCRATILYPENIDWDEMDAGIPTALFEEIMVNSFMSDKDPDSVANLIEAYREEMELLDTQMTCIISEAFPNYSIEEIEDWDMIKFCKIYSRAEWKLKNFRNMENMVDVLDYIRTSYDDEEYEDDEQAENTNNDTVIEKRESEGRKIKVGSREMDEEEYRQYLEFQKKYTDIDWSADAMFTGYETKSASTVPVAMRTNK